MCIYIYLFYIVQLSESSEPQNLIVTGRDGLRSTIEGHSCMQTVTEYSATKLIINYYNVSSVRTLIIKLSET